MTTAPRKLATIVALDVAGYSARTEADEAKTTAEVAALRQVIEGIANAHGGRVFNTAGDGFMLEFASSLAAVEATSELAAKCEPKVRVGVHLGDVVVQPNGDLLGHGVNVAARLMAQAAPGSALVSADVKRTIRGPMAERLVSRGSLKLDKMAEAIEAFALVAIATALGAVHSQPAEPTLAVLPFDNLSNDPELQFFSDGVSEEILQTVARVRGLRVIGKASCFQFRGADKNVRKVVSELRATHVVDGSVRRSGDHVRISAQLVDAATQTTMWTDRFDRNLSDVFSLQDEIAAAIASVLNTKFEPRSEVRPVAPAAYDAFLRVREMMREDSTHEEHRHVVVLLEQSVARDPEFAPAWGQLAYMRGMLLPRDRDRLAMPLREAIVASAERALSLDRACAPAYTALAMAREAFADYDEKLRLTNEAAVLAPNDPWVIGACANALSMVGRLREGAEIWNRIAQLEPLSPFLTAISAFWLNAAGRTNPALTRIDDAVQRFPESRVVWMTRWGILITAGRYDEAERMIERGRSAPATTPESVLQSMALIFQINRMSHREQELALRQLVADTNGVALNITTCGFASALGHVDFAFAELFAALDAGRPLAAWVDDGRGVVRAFVAYALFTGTGSNALRQDKRFAILCARLGLAHHWITSGHWPDCADEVPYDFRAECEKAAAKLVKG